MQYYLPAKTISESPPSSKPASSDSNIDSILLCFVALFSCWWYFQVEFHTHLATKIVSLYLVPAAIGFPEGVYDSSEKNVRYLLSAECYIQEFLTTRTDFVRQ